jgi:hypothetical protein
VGKPPPKSRADQIKEFTLPNRVAQRRRKLDRLEQRRHIERELSKIEKPWLRGIREFGPVLWVASRLLHDLPGVRSRDLRDGSQEALASFDRRNIRNLCGLIEHDEIALERWLLNLARDAHPSVYLDVLTALMERANERGEPLPHVVSKHLAAAQKQKPNNNQPRRTGPNPELTWLRDMTFSQLTGHLTDAGLSKVKAYGSIAEALRLFGIFMEPEAIKKIVEKGLTRRARNARKLRLFRSRKGKN